MSKTPCALVGETVLPGGLLRRAGVVVEGGGISAVIEAPRSGDLPADVRRVVDAANNLLLERYGEFLDALEKALPAPGANILGAHLEGPFLSPARKGAHDPENLRPVDFGLLEALLGTGMVRVMTIAPELAGSEKAAGLLSGGGAVASGTPTPPTRRSCARWKRGSLRPPTCTTP